MIGLNPSVSFDLHGDFDLTLHLFIEEILYKASIRGAKFEPFNLLGMVDPAFPRKRYCYSAYWASLLGGPLIIDVATNTL